MSTEQQSKTAEEIRSEIDCIMREAKVGFAAHWVASRPGAWGTDGKHLPPFHYEATFALERNSVGFKCFYSVGRGIVEMEARKLRPSFWKGLRAEMIAGADELERFARGGSGAIVGDSARKFLPKAADVLSSLLLDTSDLEPFMSFRKWLDNSGMEWKHPADAMECFQAIEASARFLNHAFTAEQLVRLREIAREI